MNIRHLFFIPLIFFFLSISAQEVPAHWVTPFILNDSKPALILKDARIFNEASGNSKQLAFLKAGTFVTLLSTEFTAEYLDGGFWGGFVPIQFINRNKTITGYIHNSKLASNYLKGSDGAIYGFGPDKLMKDSSNLVYYSVVRIDLTTNNLVSSQATVFNRFYTECSSDIIGSGGLTGVDFIVQFILRDEGGNLETDSYSFAWLGNKFVQLPTTQYSYEALVYTRSEKLLLPNEVKEGDDFIKVVRSDFFYEADEFGDLQEYERSYQYWYKWLNQNCIRVK